MVKKTKCTFIEMIIMLIYITILNALPTCTYTHTCTRHTTDAHVDTHIDTIQVETFVDLLMQLGV